MKKLLIIGTGGLAREFTDWSREHFEIIGYSSMNKSEHAQFNLPGVLVDDDFTPQTLNCENIVIAIGDSVIRKQIYNKLSLLGFKFPSFIHHSSIVSRLANIGEGVIISPGCVISPNVRIERLTYINFCCGVGHDAFIDAFTQINPGSQIGGFAKIGTGVLIGSGSTILQKVQIGNFATVGSGSSVFSQVEEFTTVMGNPAKRMRIFEK